MRVAVASSPLRYSNTFNHHSIFESFGEDNAAEESVSPVRSNLIQIAQSRGRSALRRQNPTFSSSIFNSEKESHSVEEHLFDRKARTPSKDLQSTQIFGKHPDNVPSITGCGRTKKNQRSRELSANPSKETDNINPVAVINGRSNSVQRLSRSQISFGGRWWETSAAPNNDFSTERSARARKQASLSNSIAFISYKPKNSPSSDNTQIAPTLTSKNNGVEVISPTTTDGIPPPQKTSKAAPVEAKAEQLKAEISCEEETQKGNHKGDSKVVSAVHPPTRKSKSGASSAVKSEDYQCKDDNRQEGQSTKTACQRHLSNLSSVLDQHANTATFKRGVAVSNDGSNIESHCHFKGKSHLPAFIALGNPKIEKPLQSANEDEEIVEIEVKSRGKRFEKENFRKFCTSKGYTALALIEKPNGRGTLFLQFASKHADPLAAIEVNLASYGVGIAGLRVIKGRDFNSMKVDPAKQILKPEPTKPPATGKKHFSQDIEGCYDRLRMLSHISCTTNGVL